MEVVTEPLNNMFGVLDDMADVLSANAGLPPDQIKYILCLVGAVPFGFVLRAMPNIPALKHLISIFTSIFFAAFALGRLSWIHAVISSLGVYLLVKFLPRTSSGSAVMIFAMSYMSISHIYRMYTDYMGWTLDFTGPQMMLTLKLTSFAYCYNDAHAKRDKDLYKEQSANQFYELPGLLEFYGYVFFFPSFLAGPSMEFSAYRAYINMSMFEKEGGKIPNTFGPALWGIGRAFLVLPITLMAMSYFPLDHLYSAEFLASPLWERLLRGWFHVMLCRSRYYFGWYLAECAFIACGADYNGRDENGNIQWNLVRNAHPILIEFGLNTKSITDNWNICTATWLRCYVYFRLMPKYGRAVATIGTYTLSAFWHGFYPGYYMFFVLAAFQTLSAQLFRERFRPLFVKTTIIDASPRPLKFERPRNGKWAYDLVTMIVSNIFASYGGGAFVLLGWERATTYWGGLMYVPVLGIMGMYFGLTALKMVMPLKRRGGDRSRAKKTD